ncbi:type VI secretion system ATPase TssH [Stieleria sp. JC731]|uniref:type VI secretion system ATPase TssH n=1 Tax=Pirellulaceae TaxID=2691357 RepID=UPI001E393AAA|nr:type VI secretion system ATPase TssH [Stieleria sp. JC731]MCC9601124.1 type VI secretion system ATPase TssH [Stieleria sp. JC731]
MSDISRTSLFGKLNSVGYKSIESATVFCKMRGNPYVELVHWINQILQLENSDLHCIVKQFNINPSRLVKDLTNALEKLPRGSTSISDLSSHIEESVERGWVYGTLMFGESQVRTGHLIVGILKTRSLKNALVSISEEFDKIKLDTLTDRFDEVVSGSPEENLGATDGFQVGGGAVPGEASGAMPPAAMGKQEALKRFTVDLTENARQGKIDPIVGRDEEIRQIIDILMRRRQNNPILTGEAGVGKTAVVEGFALKIAAGDVPPPLQDVSLRSLDVGLLQAGASMKGEFENRLKQVIEEVQASEKPIILFIDEAHTLVGAGGAEGTGDAANLLKPALARGTLRTVAATTWAEYKKHIEKDPALTRRFQVVQVEEPSEERAILMMRGMASTLEQHHKVKVLDEALEAAVRLSHRYIPARQLPDKCVSLLDTAAARVAISQHAVPAEVDDCRKRIEALKTVLGIIADENLVGVDTSDRQATAEAELKEEEARLEKLEARWNEEKDLVEQILGIRAKLRGNSGKVEGTNSRLEKAADAEAENVASQSGDSAGESAAEPASEEDRKTLLQELKSLQTKLHELQGETPLILPTVDEQAVASVVGDWTGIPVGRMVKDEVATVLNLANILNDRIIGQRHALEMIARRIQTSRASLDNPNKPIGVFMLAGPSGVGKTETALALAEALYGGEQNVITINMSEFQEAHTVSTLKGAPPGYVGYGEGGVLTEAVRRRPYSVVLLDEVEKAHHDVHEIFFQVFDKGWMEDGEGRVIDFKNTLILLTTNAGTDLTMNLCKDPELMPEAEGLAKALRPELLKVFPPALLGRIVTIPYFPLNDEMISAITKLQLSRIEKRIQKNHDLPFTYDDDVIDLIASRCTELDSGGRMIDAILTNTVLPNISSEFLTRMMEGKPIQRVHVKIDNGEFSYAFD